MRYVMDRARVADLVDALFKMHVRPDGKPYTYKDVERGTDGRLKETTVRKLRDGTVRNPGRDALMELCFFFQVPASYFFPELEVLAPPSDDVAQQNQVQVVLRSIGGLSLDDTDLLQRLIAALRRQDD